MAPINLSVGLNIRLSADSIRLDQVWLRCINRGSQLYKAINFAESRWWNFQTGMSEHDVFFYTYRAGLDLLVNWPSWTSWSIRNFYNWRSPAQKRLSSSPNSYMHSQNIAHLIGPQSIWLAIFQIFEQIEMTVCFFLFCLFVCLLGRKIFCGKAQFHTELNWSISVCPASWITTRPIVYCSARRYVNSITLSLRVI